MKPLSKEARGALASLDSVEPTAADERRVRQNLERALGVAIPVAGVATATVATTAVAAQTAAQGSVAAGLTSLGLGAKVILFAAAIGVGALVTVGVKAAVLAPVREAPRAVGGSRAPVPGAGVVKPVVVAEVRPVPELQAVDPIVVEEGSKSTSEGVTVIAAPAEVSKPGVVVASAKPHVKAEAPIAATPLVEVKPETPDVSPPPMPGAEKTEPATEEAFDVVVEENFPSCDPATEMRAALGARKLLTNNQAERALWLLSAYQKQCASGRWSDEAWRVRLSSLCKLGRNTEAASLLEWVTTEYPHRRAAIESELRHTCDPEVLKP